MLRDQCGGADFSAVCALGLSHWSIYGLCFALFTKILSLLVPGEDAVGKSSLSCLSTQKKTILSFFSVPQTLCWLLIIPTGRSPIPGQSRPSTVRYGVYQTVAILSLSNFHKVSRAEGPLEGHMG